ncbi:aminoglycoside phosphotransferase family protein [Streptomyces sp. NPDC004610]|uniref:aminoglycoside phosphotransferase family protein n=1 Tax=unclassified Streptomyces TaxID=2593676 RepID=UPI0033ADC23D
MIEIPEQLATAQARYNGEAGRAFLAGLPALAAHTLDHWNLRPDGPPMSGMTALVLPVVQAPHTTPAVLKLPFRDEETAAEPAALRAWDGDGAVRLLAHDPATGALLLERLDPARTLAQLPDPHEAVTVIARLLAHLTRLPAPEGTRTLRDIAAEMLDRTPWALRRVPDPAVRRLVADCAAAVREVLPQSGDRLLHWDLHYGNVLGAERAPWLAIDPKPLAGDPGFDLYPALANRFDPPDIPWRLDALTDALSLDRERARAWTLGRVLQNCLWDIGGGEGVVGVVGAEVVEIGRWVRGWG